MPERLLLAVIAGFLAGLPATGHSAAENTDQVRSWVTHQMAFQIPFSVSSSADDGTPKAVELYVSRDGGESWRLYKSQDPGLGRFQFRAEQEGEYWFASRTVERNRPPVTNGLRPELRVVIDRAQPELSFEVKLAPSGEIEARFSASDPTLDPATFKVEYQPRVDQPWKPIPLQRRGMKSGNGSMAGELRWWPDASAAEAVPVRAEVADGAGNKAVINRVVLLPPRRAERGAPGSIRTAIPADPFRRLAENGIAWPKDNRLESPTPATGPTRVEHFVNKEDVAPSPVAAPQTPALAGDYPKTKATATAARPVATEFAKKSAPLRRIPAPDGELPPGETARMTRSRQFRLDYAIESADSSGVRKVELWGTSDFGKTWSNWKLDEDRQSPVEVTVDAEGIYGFRVVVVAGNGLAGSVPRNGEPADLWVGVDTTAPSAELISAKYGDPDHFGQLDIRWEASDRWLTERPITLLFSDKPAGPWTTIRSGLPNTGQLYWPVEPRIPDRIYLRMEVRDQAGNTTSHQFADPIALTGLFPKARIRAVLP